MNYFCCVIKLETTKRTHLFTLKKEAIMAIKKGVWDTILKVIIAVASAVLGALGGSTM